MLMPPPNSDHTTPRDDANFYFILFYFLFVFCVGLFWGVV